MNSTILVIEPDDAMRTLIRDVLTSGGYRVQAASDKASAIASMAAEEPKLAFAVPESLGAGESSLVEVARKLGFILPVVLLVDGAGDDPLAVVREYAAFSYLKKPVDRSRLLMLACEGTTFMQSASTREKPAGDLSRLRELTRSALTLCEGVVFILDPEALVVEFGGPLGAVMASGNGDPRGKPYLSLFPAPVAKVQAGTLSMARLEGQDAHHEDRRGGTVFQTRIRPVYEDGDLAGFIVTIRDTTAETMSSAGLADSEKQYRNVFEGASDAILMVDTGKGCFIDANGAACRALGYGREEIAGMEIADISGDADRTVQAIGAGVKRIPIVDFRRKNGTTYPVEVALSYFSSGGRDFCVMYAQDISRRKVVEEALREGARLYRAVVEDQTELICRYSPDGTLTFVNGAYARFFNVDEDDAVGTDFFACFDPMDILVLNEWLNGSGSTAPVYEQEVRKVGSDGREYWIQWTHRAVLGEMNRVTEIQAVGRDITDRKEAENALNQANIEKEQYRLNLVATFKSIPDAILTVDSDLVIMASNSAAATLFNYDRGRMRGLNLADLVDGDGHPCVGVLKQVLKTDKPVRGYEIELESPTLGERMVEITCSPLVGQDQQHAGAVLVVRDISHIADLEKQLQQRHGFRGIVGRSSAMQDIYQLLEQLSPLDSIVLILGESGTGKELVAEALHYGGPRAGKPLIKVNCSALSESLLESELFGHVRGAFTGAVRDKVGRIQAAQGGTLFLDEIGDISPLLQLKLLRFLEQKEYERVGDSKTYSADVRIIAATNVDMLESVRQGAFREDLYYRLNVMPVTLPALRERQADIPLLVEHFLSSFSDHFSKKFEGVSDEVMDLFMGYRWPGNVRELRHALEHACILSPGKIIQLKHIRKDLVEHADPVVPEPAACVPSFTQQGYYPMRKPGRDDVLAVLNQCGGNKVRAAEQLGIHRATLYRKLKAWGIDA